MRLSIAISILISMLALCGCQTGKTPVPSEQVQVSGDLPPLPPGFVMPTNPPAAPPLFPGEALTPGLERLQPPMPIQATANRYAVAAIQVIPKGPRTTCTVILGLNYRPTVWVEYSSNLVDWMATPAVMAYSGMTNEFTWPGAWPVCFARTVQ